jgi:hypothetical protein
MIVTFGEVSEQFINDHPLAEGSNGPAFWNLEEANRQFEGRWVYRTLTPQETLGAVLSHHDHWREESEVKLVPNSGLTVVEAVSRYRTLMNYQGTNPLCWQTLEFVKLLRNDVYLSTSPLNTPDFQPLHRFSPNHLIVLDGLHRLISWRLDQEKGQPGLKEIPVHAFIAGEVS